MSKQIMPGKTGSHSVSNKKIRGFKFGAYIVHGTTNTDLANSDFLPENLLIELVLKRGNGEHFVLPQTKLKVAHLASTFYNAAFEKSAPNMSASAATVLVEKAVGVYEKWLFELAVIMPGIYDLRGGDELVLNVNFQESAYSANISTSSSYLQIDEIEGEGEETFTPRMRVETIDAAVNEFSTTAPLAAGMVFVNLDKTDLLAASTPITSISFTSNKQKYNKLYIDLLNDRILGFTTKAASDARLQCFDLMERSLQRDVNVNIQLVSTNVNAQKCFVVTYDAYQSARLIKRASAVQKLEQVETALSAGLTVPTGIIKEVNSELAATQPAR